MEIRWFSTFKLLKEKKKEKGAGVEVILGDIREQVFPGDY